MDQQLAARLAGLKTEPRRLPYTWRDCALYALAVGAGGLPEELSFVYEKGMQPLPTFGVLPYWCAVGVEPPLSAPRALPNLAGELLSPQEGAFVNLDCDLRIHRPHPPAGGTLCWQETAQGVYDRGEGRGLALRSALPITDEGGQPLYDLTCTALFPQLGGFGGAALPPWEGAIPDGEASLVVEDALGPVQHLLYRLTGDTNPVHCDPAAAQERGLPGPFVHDLCTFGYACRLAIHALFPGQPQRLTRMAAQFKTILYPGDPIALHLWQQGEGQAAFRLVNRRTGKAALDKGLLRWH